MCNRLAGWGYHHYYKYLVLQKMGNAFKPGDPALEIAALSKSNSDAVAEKDDQHWIRRAEQDKIDNM